jgi:hypothetical protein
MCISLSAGIDAVPTVCFCLALAMHIKWIEAWVRKYASNPYAIKSKQISKEE